MSTTLRLLLVEDTEDDATLILRALRATGFSLATLRVQTAGEFCAALDSQPWDLVISDHSLPQFSSTAALACLHERELDLPFIVVSGTIDEETAVSILKAGAHDFVTKQNLARLVPAISRELQEARNRAERRAAQRDLRVQRDFLRLVVDSNPSLIFVKDSEGRFTLANRATADLYGTTVDDLVGKRDEDFHRNLEDAEHFLRGERDVIATGQTRLVPAEPLTDARTGDVRWFETRLVPLVVPEGKPQILGVGAEITERRMAEEALRLSEEQFRQAQKMEAVGQLAGGIAHDFNNLLTAILGYSELLMDRVRDLPDIAADLEEIRKAGQRASSLTSQLLAFSRKQVLDPQVLDLGQVVAGVQKMLRRVIGEHIRLETTAAPDLKPVTADRGQTEQILINLAINARDAMPLGGVLRVETANTLAPPELLGSPPEAAPPQCVALRITDTGSGMPPEIRTRIFEPFFTTKGPGKGTGLGLSMVHGVVTQSGGWVTVESERDRGTTFTIYLPVSREQPRTGAPGAQAPAELRGHETILLVEDEVAIRELVRKVLSSYGYHVLEAGDTGHALAIAERHSGPIHLLLSDIVMPHMSGPELAQRLVATRRDIRVLYMSGFGNRLSTAFGSMSAGVDMLHKPFTPDRLARKVREFLNGVQLTGRR